MRYLWIVAIAAAALWSGYWFVGSHRESRNLADWLNARAAAGWTASYSRVQTRGFPNRFDTTISDPVLAGPAGTPAWSAAFVQLLRLSYNSRHYVVVAPPRQGVTVAGQRQELVTGRARGSVVFSPGDAHEIERATIELDQPAVTSHRGWSAGAERLLVALKRSDAPGHYRLGVEVGDARLATEGGGEAAFWESIRIDAGMTMDAALDRSAAEARVPAVTEIDLRTLELRLGVAELSASGLLTVDAAGQLSGRLDLTVRHWRDLLDPLAATGLDPSGLRDGLPREIEQSLSRSGSDPDLATELLVDAGRLMIGDVYLGRIPAMFR